MWLFVMFDLPVLTDADRKAAAKFRKVLLKNGFSMLQYSVYIKHVPSLESADVYTNRVKVNKPAKGEIVVVRITDKQYGDMITVRGKGAKVDHGSCGPQLDIF